MMRIGAISAVWLLTVAFCAAGRASEISVDARRVLNRHCTKCHGGVKQAGGLSFLYGERVVGAEGVVVPTKPDESELIRRVTSSNASERMPPVEESPTGLSAEEITILKTWVSEGAVWSEHWAFVPPKETTPPEVQHAQWCLTPLDRFVLASLERADMSPAAEADRAQWLRRVTFDLTGLPPTPKEIEEFLADASTDAHRRVVKRLLASQRFGERWAAVWLDLARYADSMGYERDPPRVMWPYRDWVIRALNADMPFDEFTVKQLAGDLLADPTLDDLIATGFHRNSQTNTEGGTDDEEFRTVSVIDRVSTTWTVWQGITFGCAQCHNHPYAPFRQEEFYSFAAFFNNAEDCDQRDEYPTLRVPQDRSHNERSLRLQKEIADLSREAMRPFQEFAAAAQWQDLELKRIESNKPRAKLKIRKFGGRDEVFAEGTVGQQSVYTAYATSPLEPITALRVDVPLLEGHDAANPSPAFVVTGSQVRVERSGGTAEPIAVAFVAADAAGGMFWPAEKWGAFPNQFHDRWAVLVFGEPVALADGDRLVVTLKQSQGRDGAAPPVLRRFRMSVSDEPVWTGYVTSQTHRELIARRAKLVGQLNKIASVRLPIMRERPVFRRQDAVFNRGNWLDKGAVVQPAVPGALPSLGNDAERVDRLAMARWLVAEDNPLTGRVLVNRVWAELFGSGIVETAEDFGPTGTRPTHPELLDGLAVRFSRDYQWSLKRLLEEIVLSATYRQDGRATPEAVQRDPRNRLLARGPRNRLTAEMVRDQALATSGLLSNKMFGPSVMPPQPAGVWQTPYSGQKWVTPKGEDRYRRGVYTYWRRSSPYPSFLVFDMSTRQVCAARRIATNTPLPALVTMNDPVYVEASQALAKRMMAEGGSDAPSWIAFGLRLSTSRAAREEDVDTLSELYRQAAAVYAEDPIQSDKLGGSPAEAAMVLVANTILNLDESLSK